LLIESTPLKAGWLAPNISPQGITSLSPMEFKTSDHRVAGSSPAGFKASPRAYWQAIYALEIDVSKASTCQSLATFDTIPLDLPINADIYAQFHLKHLR
jgi:hypothetical protein